MIKTSIFSLILFLNFSSAIANTSQYFCTGDANQFFLNLNKIKKTIILGDETPKKYWIKGNYIFWHSFSDYSVYEYTFIQSYNKLSGELKVKSHHLITSENTWYFYKCSVSQ